MYAIIESGSKQYRVAPSDFIEVELLDTPVGQSLRFERVLFVSDEGGSRVGTPTVEGAIVNAEHVGMIKGEKIINFKFKKRKNQRRKKGHRQKYSRVRILEITNTPIGEEAARGT